MLAQSDGETRVIAGGQSLMPMMNFRLLSPSVLVGINGIRDLDYVRIEDGALHVGALTRHHRLETSPTIAEQFPVLRAAMACVAHLAIRNRGTLGGSLSHADPAAELPMMLVLLDGEIRIAGAGGERVVAARDFFLGALTPDLEEDEILVEVRLPLLPRGSGWGFEEFAQRSGDFALAAAAATVTLSQGTVSEARVALMGVDDTPLRLPAGEDLLRGRALDRDLINRVAALARDAVNPNTDLHASADYRRHLAEVLTRRVLGQAWRRVAEEPS